MKNDEIIPIRLENRSPDFSVAGARINVNPNGIPSKSDREKGIRPRIRIKKIPPDMRRRKPSFSREPNLIRRVLFRLQHDAQFLRSSVQLAFVLLCVWIGVEFYYFMQWGFSGDPASPATRPPGVEGFLPISALLSLRYWFEAGIISPVHPAGLFILVAIIAVSLFAKKAFCSWLCPIGTLSEALWMLGKKIFGRNLSLPRWLDYPLRSLKYFLLGFFVISIFGMDVDGMKAFLDSPYNRVADVKMFMFFANISTFALWSIIILMVLSIFVQNFWCRYLCPYGALLGALSWLSPLKITRNKATCVDCELCTKVCPARIKVHISRRVWSDECMSCLLCTDICPVKETLEMRPAIPAVRVPSWAVGALVVGLFVAVTGLAILAGHWQTSISPAEYLQHFRMIDTGLYTH